MDRSVLQNLDALLITNTTNIRYLTGFVGVAEDEREAYVLLFKNDAFLFTSGLYKEQARSQLLNCYIAKALNKPVSLIEISNEKTIWKRLKEIFDSIPRNQNTKVGFEEDDLKVSEFNTLRKELKGVTLIPTKNHIEEMRMIKREDEIENIREAARLTDECFEYIVGKLKPGVTESEIAWEIESHVHVGGAHELAFSPIVAFGKNSSQPHYGQCQMSNAKCQMNDIVLMDFGIKVNGYCADMTRVVFVGKPKDEWLRAYNTVLHAQKSAIEYLSQNQSLGTKLSGKKADQLARTIIKEAGFPVYPHSLGHGVGLAIHEAPRLTYKKNVNLQPGMIITVEPGIYIEGQYGIRIEDLILLKKNGIEIFTQSSKKLIII